MLLFNNFIYTKKVLEFISHVYKIRTSIATSEKEKPDKIHISSCCRCKIVAPFRRFTKNKSREFTKIRENKIKEHYECYKAYLYIISNIKRHERRTINNKHAISKWFLSFFFLNDKTNVSNRSSEPNTPNH